MKHILCILLMRYCLGCDPPGQNDKHLDLPAFERIVPTETSTDSETGMTDAELQRIFPGQFYSKEQISEIDHMEHTQARHRRDTDYDLCCPTKVWFGSAPENMTDIEGNTWSIVCGQDIQQAFSRGDCVETHPQESCGATSGVCRQKTRLVWLWVEKEPGSRDLLYKYFKVNSHCAYEHVGRPTDK